MKNIQTIIFLTLILVLGFFYFMFNSTTVKAIDIESLSGKILIQAQQEGQAWYVYPDNNRRYFLGRPQEAFDIMRKLSLGVKHNFIVENNYYSSRYKGKILLDVEDSGKAYYIDTNLGEKHYLGRPQEAFDIMRDQGLGITKADLEEIAVGNLNEVYNEKINIEVPFISQAPFGDWSDPRLQDACEEASVFMAMKWIEGESISATEAREEFFDISKFEEENYGSYKDTSAKDTLERIIKGYYNYNKAELKYNFSLEDIITELDNGNLIIVPTNGQDLNNPYYSGAGPERHMLVIKGYDRGSNEFITNDPGTRHGADFRFSFDNLYNSIRDYPSGDHVPIVEEIKAMIVIYN
ncbi:MAG: C39 family peptidase [Parcubacteria group bacterium]